MRKKFTIASELLRELGERLVGRPHIALAELVKNAYDADATTVTIRVDEDLLEVRDDGHGMDQKDIEQRWLRIGSPHKRTQEVSEEQQRPLTGSKGVGRLAVQFLGRELELVTRRRNGKEATVTIDWDEAIEQAEELTEVQVELKVSDRPKVFAANERGTIVRIRRLAHAWTTDEVNELAREVWTLQPPRPTGEDDSGFRIELVSPYEDVQEEFDRQMNAVLTLWEARIVGKIVRKGTNRHPARVSLALEYKDGPRFAEEYGPQRVRTESGEMSGEPLAAWLGAVEFEILVFDFRRRQKHGIRVGAAREYLSEHGGVHIYDRSFHLPYYGPSEDWLGIEADHAHRLKRSKLLPKEMHVERALNDLPTTTRIFGTVKIDTARERQLAVAAGAVTAETLAIQISRDRLVDNRAFEALRSVVRWALDYYAFRTRQRNAKRELAEGGTERLTEPVARALEIIDDHEDELPSKLYVRLRSTVESLTTVAEQKERSLEARTNLLAVLASAGISALALDHEMNRQLAALEIAAKAFASAGRQDARHFADRVLATVNHIRNLRGSFGYVASAPNRERVRRLKARAVLEDVVENSLVFLRGVDIEHDDLAPDLRLPAGTYAEWFALFQNLLTNAVNAMLDADEKRLVVRSARRRGWEVVDVLDTGVGVDVETSEELFEPFERRLEISADRRELVVGGTGLGLTIVRTIAETRGFRVRFVDPPADARDFNTCVEIAWKESR
jgi:signal transduction histidine kinase